MIIVLIFSSTSNAMYGKRSLYFNHRREVRVNELSLLIGDWFYSFTSRRSDISKVYTLENMQRETL